jgi:hypothetical protein
LLARLLPAHSIGDDEQVGRIQRQGGRFAVAFGRAIVPHRPAAGNIKIVLVVFAVIPADRDDADLQFELAGKECE